MANIRKRGKSYQITISNGRDRNGKQIIETATFRPDPARTERQNQKALEKFAIEFEEKVKSGKYLDGEKLTFYAFACTWLNEYAEQHLTAATVEAHRILLEQHVFPVIGSIKLAKLQPLHLNKLYNAMATERKDGNPGGYSPATIRRTHATISSVMSTAVKWNVLLDNPCERVTLPKVQRSESIKFFTLEETEAFLSALDQDYQESKISLQHKVFFHLALFCGLRRGELIALEWSDIDLVEGTVSVTKSTGLVGGKPVTKQPKNSSSMRVVSIPASVVDLLREHRRQQLRYRLSLGTYWKGDNYIFTQSDGSQMYPSTPYATFQKIIKRYNDSLPPDAPPLPRIPLHGLRHTSATLLISQNVDVRTVSGRLGHAQTSTTMNIYSHQLQSVDRKAASVLDDLLQAK